MPNDTPPQVVQQAPQQIQISGDTDVPIVFQAQMWQQIVQVLAKGPYEVVAGPIQSINSQIIEFAQRQQQQQQQQQSPPLPQKPLANGHDPDGVQQ